MKRLSALIILLHPQLSFCESWDLGELMSQFSHISESRSAFTESKTSLLLETPLESQGMLYFKSPDKLTKEITSPEKSTWFIYGDEVILERPGEAQKRFPVDAHPALRPLATSIRSLLAGQLQEINKYYSVRLEGEKPDWMLMLTPLSESLQAYIQSIVISGQNDTLKSVITESTNGDKATLTLVNH